MHEGCLEEYFGVPESTVEVRSCILKPNTAIAAHQKYELLKNCIPYEIENKRLKEFKLPMHKK